MQDKVDILGVLVDNLTMDSAIGKVRGFLGSDRPHTIFTPNSEIILAAHRDKGFREILNSASMLTADGIGVVYASRIVKKPIAERVAGFDLGCRILEEAAKGGHGVFLFGAKPGVAEVAAKNLVNKYTGLKIAGTENGYFTEQDNDRIVENINSSGADILFVCLGAPKQEIWIYKNKTKLKPKVIMGIGGSLDVFAGNAQRAPVFWQRAGLEWLYRLIKEPRRIWRMRSLPIFGLTVLFCGRRYKKGGR